VRSALRQEWLLATVAQIQAIAGAPLNPEFDVYQTLATAVARIPPPRTTVERLYVGQLLEQAARRLVEFWYERHGTSHHVTHAQCRQWVKDVCDIVRRTEWAALPNALYASGSAISVPSLAVRVRAYLDDAFCQPLTLGRLARAVGGSVHAVTDAFRAEYGMSIHTYVTRRRVGHALQLLISTDLKVSAIAQRAGFRSTASLYRNFQHAGLPSPAAIREHPTIARRAVADLALPPLRRNHL